MNYIYTNFIFQFLFLILFLTFNFSQSLTPNPYTYYTQLSKFSLENLKKILNYFSFSLKIKNHFGSIAS